MKLKLLMKESRLFESFLNFKLMAGNWSVSTLSILHRSIDVKNLLQIRVLAMLRGGQLARLLMPVSLL